MEGTSCAHNEVLGIGTDHHPPQVWIYREREKLDKDSSIEWHIVKVNRLRLVIDDSLAGNGIICVVGSKRRRTEMRTELPVGTSLKMTRAFRTGAMVW